MKKTVRDYMKLYTTGLMTIIAYAGASTALSYRETGFITESPLIFWGMQIIIWIVLAVMSFQVLHNWEDTREISKQRFAVSLFSYVMFYAIGFVGKGWFPHIILFILAVMVAYIERDKAGLVRH